MKENAKAASGLLKCLAHPARLLLVCQLLEGRKSVGELAELLGLRQSSMSQQLTQLRLCGVVAPMREGQTVYYSLTSPAAQAVVATLYEQFCVVSPRPKRKA